MSIYPTRTLPFALDSPRTQLRSPLCLPFCVVKSGPDSPQLRNNSYAATFGEDGWGAKAQKVLGAVRGKDFTREKNKKKRSNYRGGAIDMGSNSIKFESDDE